VFASQSASGQVLNESAKLLPSDGAWQDLFGESVSVSGGVAVVGAFYDDDNGTNSGSAYVFRWNPGAPGSWVQEQKLLASDGAAYDLFGQSVSVSGDVAVVGARLDDDNGDFSGSAYVFRWNGSSWLQQQKLLPSDGANADSFGVSVSVSGDVAVVGAFADDDNGSDSGSAYVFRWNGSSWAQHQKLLPSDGAAADYFGVSVSVSGDVAVVGACLDNDNGTFSGSAYVFRWNGSTWVQEQKLLASDGATEDRFGYSVSVSGDVAVVGAWNDNVDGSLSGSAYVFRWNPGAPGSWVQEQKLLASDGAASDHFGESVSVSGDVAVVGAYHGADTNSGLAYVFRWNGSTWVQEQKLLASDRATNDQFGWSVSVSGGVAVVGANYDADNGDLSGSAYVFNLVLGTCCISNGSCEAAGNCRENITPSACQALGGRFFGPDLLCADVCANGACIPTVSAWGIVVLLLLIATAGTIVLARGRVRAR
jgi:hypothetical protein